MDIDDAREFVKRNHRAVLCTYRRDGTAQLSPVLVGVDADGRLEISSIEPRAKVRNLRRDPRATVCVFPDKFFGGSWIQLDGTAELLSLPGAMEPLVEYYRRLSGEHPNWDEYRAAAVEGQAVLIKIAIERVGPHRRA